MTVSAIVAVSENNAIGHENKLPWNLPEDLKYFKRKTLGKPVLMGRKTFESLGKALPGRINIVLSRQADLQLPHGVLLYDSLDAALQKLEDDGTEEAFVIGGGHVFAEAMPLIDSLYITRVHTIIKEADTFFPEVDHSHWKLVWEEAHEADEKNNYAYTFEHYERIEL